MVLGEKFPPIAPIHFFRISADLKYGKEITRKFFGKGYQLPDTSSFLGEEHFADVGVLGLFTPRGFAADLSNPQRAKLPLDNHRGLRAREDGASFL